MFRTLRCMGMWLLAAILFLPACQEEVAEEPVVKLPPREHTWVRKETVKKTKEDFFAKEEFQPHEIPINGELLEDLTNSRLSGTKASMKDTPSCLAGLKPLDEKRTLTQKAGGMWHAFEKSPEIRGLSENGMQIDSTLNKMIASLRHLCNTAKGLPGDNTSQLIARKVTEMGQDAVAKEFLDLGEAEADVDIWMEYAEYWKKNEKRNLDYSSIEKLMRRVTPMIDLYSDMAQREVNENTKQSFLSDAVTLLEAMKMLSSKNEYMVLALKEDRDAPYENFDPDM